MANWAYTQYAIEGSKETLEKIQKALNNPILTVGSSEGWEGGVLDALGIPKKYNDTLYYLRGFVNKDSINMKDGVLQFDATEAWGATDFRKALEEFFSDIKVFFSVSESCEDLYATNDKEGKYFPTKYYVEYCVDDDCHSEFFTTKNQIYDWLKKYTQGRVFDENSMEEFNSDYEDSDAYEENFIYIHEFKIVD